MSHATQNPLIIPLDQYEMQLTDGQLEQLSDALSPLRVEVTPTGQLEIMAPVSHESANYEGAIYTEIVLWVRSSMGSGSAVTPDAGFRLPDGSVRAPDAGWFTGEKKQAAYAERKGFPYLCPVFVVEVKSPNDSLNKLKAKLGLWVKNGAEVAWLVNPETSLTHVLRRAAPETFEEVPFDQPLTAAAAMTGFSLTLADLPI